MTSWDFCLIKNVGLGFDMRIEYISLMATLKKKISGTKKKNFTSAKFY
jgi:hypothetical protein